MTRYAYNVPSLVLSLFVVLCVLVSRSIALPCNETKTADHCCSLSECSWATCNGSTTPVCYNSIKTTGADCKELCEDSSTQNSNASASVPDSSVSTFVSPTMGPSSLPSITVSSHHLSPSVSSQIPPSASPTPGTIKPPTTSTKPTTTTKSSKKKVTPSPSRKFDALSFVGGMLLLVFFDVAVMAFIYYRRYKKRAVGRNYSTVA